MIISVIFALLLSFTYCQNENSMIFLQQQSYDPNVVAADVEPVKEDPIVSININAGNNGFTFKNFTNKEAYLKLKVNNTDSRLAIFTDNNRDKFIFTVNYTKNTEEKLVKADFNDNVDIKRNDYNIYLEKVPEGTTFVLVKLTLKETVETFKDFINLASVNKVVEVSTLQDKLNEYEVKKNLAIKLTGLKGKNQVSKPIVALYTGLPENSQTFAFINGYTSAPKAAQNKVQEDVKRKLEGENATTNNRLVSLIANHRTLKDSDVAYFYVELESEEATKINIQLTQTQNLYSLNSNYNRYFSLAKGNTVYLHFNSVAPDSVVFPRLVTGSASLYVVSKPNFEVKSLTSYEEQFKDAKEVKSFRTNEEGSLLVKVVANSSATGSLDVSSFIPAGSDVGHFAYIKLDTDEVKVNTGKTDGGKYKQIVTLDDLKDNEISYALGTEKATKLEEGKSVVKDLEKINVNTFKRTQAGKVFAVALIVTEEQRNVKDELVATDKLSKSTAFTIETKENFLIRVFEVKKGSKVTSVDFNVTLGELTGANYRVVPASYKDGENLYANVELKGEQAGLGSNYAHIPVQQSDVDSLLIVKLEFAGNADRKVDVYYDSDSNSKFLTGGLFLLVALVAALLF